jgi:hypothetical protein
MATRNLECQIAQLQIGRYLNGDPLSADALVSLEGHISECPGCAADLRLRKIALQANLPTVETVPAAPASAPHPAPSAAGPRILDLLREKSAVPTHAVVEVPVAAAPITIELPEEEPETRREMSPATRRAIAYGMGLVAVLLFMSTIGRDPTRYLGERANAALPVSVGSQPTQSTPATQKADAAVENGSALVVDPAKPQPKPVTTSAANPGTTPTTPVTNPEDPVDESWTTLNDVLPLLFADPMRTFNGDPNEIEATLAGTEEMLARMEESEAVAAAPAPRPTTSARRNVAPRRVVRRPVRREPRPQPENRIERVETPGITMFPPEGNP